jgi:hypothetical protein
MKRIDWKNISHTCTTYLALTLTQFSTTPVQAADETSLRRSTAKDSCLAYFFQNSF